MILSEADTEMCYLISSYLSSSLLFLSLTLIEFYLVSQLKKEKKRKENETFLKQDKFTCEAKLSDEPF